MKLVLSGPLDDSLTNLVVAITEPRTVTRLHPRAIRFETVRDEPDVQRLVADACNVARVDHAFVDSEFNFGKIGLIAMDMDSTLITIECIDEIADFVGKKAEVAAITEAAMRGEIPDFAESLRRRVALLAGADANVLRRVFEDRLELSQGAEQLVGAAKAGGAYTVLVSGGFTYFTDRLVQVLKLDAGHANRLEIIEGRITGGLIEPILGALEKAQIVERAMLERHQSSRTAAVIGDGSNDIPMMRLVKNSVAYRAKPAVLAVARHAVRFGSMATIVDYFS